MTFTNKESVIKALKEIGRLVVFAVPGIAIQVISGDAALAASYGGVALTLLKGLDKYIHENSEINKTGLLPF